MYTKPGGTAGVDLSTLVPAIDVVWDRSFFILLGNVLIPRCSSGKEIAK